MSPTPKELQALRDKAKGLQQELITEATAWVSKILRRCTQLGVCMLFSVLVYGLLQRKKPKVDPEVRTAPARRTSLWLRLLHYILRLSILKGPYPQLKALLPRPSMKVSQILLSLLLSILPWCVRFLVGAYARRKSRTSS